MLETFSEKMTALADAVRSKFGITGSLTVADMVTAVSGQPYSSAGATLAGWDTDMHALGSAIRSKVGGTAELTIDEMAAAVGQITTTLTTYLDPDLVHRIDIGDDFGDANRIGMTLPAGTYSEFRIGGLYEGKPSRIEINANRSGGGTSVSFDWYPAAHTAEIEDSFTLQNGNICLWYTNFYSYWLSMSPIGNSSPGIPFTDANYKIYYALAWDTLAFSKTISTADSLLLTFKYTPPAAMLMTAPRRGSDEVTPEMEAEYQAYWEAMKAEAASEAGGETV